MTLAVVYIIFRETKGSGALRKSRSFEDECKGDVKTFASFMEKRAGGLKEKVLHVPIVGSAIFAAYSLLLPYFPMLSPVLGALPRVLLWIRGLQRWVVIPTNVAVFATNAIRKFAGHQKSCRSGCTIERSKPHQGNKKAGRGWGNWWEAHSENKLSKQGGGTGWEP